MKKYILFLGVLLIFVFVGCSKKDIDIVSKLDNKISKFDKYKLTGILSISNNDDMYTYDVSVSYLSKDKYRVSLINKSNNHEQVILKNDGEVYVITPALNKSFKFQSNWPLNNSQVYILESILYDIKNDSEKEVVLNDDLYIITTKVNYSNNIDLVKQKIYVDKDCNIKKVEVINNSGIVEMTMDFKEFDDSPMFDDNFFNLNSIVSDIDNESSIESESSVFDNIIYPLYVPSGTVLKQEEKINKDKGERVILTFDGEKPFLLVEETADVEKEFSIVPVFGEPTFLKDTVGAVTDNSLNWVSGGIEYYLVSDVMNKNELIEIANSISVIPIMK